MWPASWEWWCTLPNQVSLRRTRRVRTNPGLGSKRGLIYNKLGFAAKFGILTVLEGGLIIIAACIISIWPLFTQVMPRRVMPRRFHTTFSRSTSRRTQHLAWYLRRIPTNSESQEGIARPKEVSLPKKKSWSSLPSLLSSPSSLADLEDQRWSILMDEEVSGSHKTVAGTH